ncbi:MAG: hypothetical protein WCR49_10760, partial [Opitutae bacterium]
VCHPERSEGSMASKAIARANAWILHFVQNDRSLIVGRFEYTPANISGSNGRFAHCWSNQDAVWRPSHAAL